MESRVVQRWVAIHGDDRITETDVSMIWGINGLTEAQRYRNPLCGYGVWQEPTVPIGALVTVLLQSKDAVPVALTEFTPAIGSYGGDSRLTVDQQEYARSKIPADRLAATTSGRYHRREEHVCVVTGHIPYRRGIKYQLKPVGTGIVKRCEVAKTYRVRFPKSIIGPSLRDVVLESHKLAVVITEHNILRVLKNPARDNAWKADGPYDCGRVVFEQRSVTDELIDQFYAALTALPSLPSWVVNLGTPEEAKLRRASNPVIWAAAPDMVCVSGPRDRKADVCSFTWTQEPTWLHQGQLQLAGPPAVVPRSDLYRVFAFQPTLYPLPALADRVTDWGGVVLAPQVRTFVGEGNVVRVYWQVPQRPGEQLWNYVQLLLKLNDTQYLARILGIYLFVADDGLVVMDTRSIMEIPTTWPQNAGTIGLDTEETDPALAGQLTVTGGAAGAADAEPFPIDFDALVLRSGVLGYQVGSTTE